MSKNQKLGWGFLAIGFLIIPLSYALFSREAFVIATCVGLMAMTFGGFQLLINKPYAPQTATVSKSRKVNRRR
ncbi:hypothetical protein [Cellvibrio sp. PSBB006]|uniref:hypothetical protein n=1 Tax=Cellvibrio sp. PSBB006 TaxID=1987723 RepID=UPI000B3B2700|nr:hypothetical protein [Cellvibrio sp. PSBB006]ARU26165.1 hypothetical protein CBR65_01250 [Cellvibrio sp. PSBB006]